MSRSLRVFAVNTLFSSLLLALSGQAEAVLVYSNGPIAGTTPYSIDAGGGLPISNSFIVSSPASLASAQAGLWVYEGATPVSLDWAIGTTPFATDLGSGSASLSNTPVDTFDGFAIFESVFPVSTGLLSPGTYYFTLGNALASAFDFVAWDVNFGPSTGYFDPETTQDSNSFQLFSIPEPSSLTLLGVGALSLFRIARRRRA